MTSVSHQQGSDDPVLKYSYIYGANGNVAEVKDHELNRTIWTEYDQAQRQ